MHKIRNAQEVWRREEAWMSQGQKILLEIFPKEVLMLFTLMNLLIVIVQV